MPYKSVMGRITLELPGTPLPVYEEDARPVAGDMD